MFSFVAQISSVVSEKEFGLRQALRTMGMTDAAYWLSWGAWELTLAFVSGHLITCFGECSAQSLTSSWAHPPTLLVSAIPVSASLATDHAPGS